LAAERTQREKAEMEAAVARSQPVLSHPATAEADRIALPSAPAYSQPQGLTAQQKSEARIRLFERFNAVMTTRDTPRGLTITIPDAAFSGGSLRPAFVSSVARVAAVIQSQPNLQIAVEGHTDSSSSEGLSWKRAEAVRNVLLQQGLNSNAVALRGLGNTRPLAANSTPGGRLENRRVEIIISGDPIGSVPFWDHTYKLK
jgi:outer membrane protein OmpA-like peptidoglycan-associated protein